MVLVDTSVWIDWLRGGGRPASRLLDKLIDEEDLALAPIVLQELLQGARGEREAAELRARFSALHVLMPVIDTYAEAGILYARCRWAGITPRSLHDCLMAVLAVDNGVALLHDDADFVRIAGVEPRLTLLPIA